MAPNAFWWQWPCSSARFGDRPERQVEPPGSRLARQEFLEQQRVRGQALARSSL